MNEGRIRAAVLAACGFIGVLVAAYFAGAFDGPVKTGPEVVANAPKPADPKIGPGKGDALSAADSDAMAPAAPAAGTVPAPAGGTASGGAPETGPEMAALPPAGERPAPTPIAPPPGETAAKPSPSGTPTFDVVRVEGDGSMVVAGKAAAGSKIELMNGSAVIASAVAGTEGDFAAVLDKPLSPGAYQFTIRSTAPDGAAIDSTQTAVVTVPDKASGDVLAMVQEPGQASEIISAPAAKTADVPAPAVPSDAPAAAAMADASPAAGGAVGGGAAASAEPAPAQPPAGQPPPAPASAAEASPAPAEAGTGGAARPAASAVQLAVQAVEIEGAKIFIAGSAPDGGTVRVYANDALIGESATRGGRFLVEAVHELPVGSYTIRADMLDHAGAVTARAAVPFQRDAGEDIAAVAPEVPAAGAAEPPAAAEPGTAVAANSDSASAAAPGTDVPAVRTGPAATAQAGTSDTPAPTPDESGAAPGTGGRVTVFGSAEPADAAAAGQAEAPAASTQADASAGTAKVGVASAVGSATAGAPATAPAETASAAAAGGSPATAGPDVAPATADRAGEAAATPTDAAPAVAGALAETNAPKLQTVDGAVIIRRGDSLWRISRRVYGRGVRYSTIYLANQTQIEDPNRIWPGQVFRMPGKSDGGEAADMKAIGDQATTMPAEEKVQ